MKRSLSILALTALLTVPGRAAEFPVGWQYSQSVRFEQTGLLRFEVPAAIIDVCQIDLRDLRLFDDAGRELPHVFERMPAGRPVPEPVTSFQSTLTADTTVVALTTGTTQRLAAVTLETPAPDFLKAATVEGSTDGRAWTRLGSGEPLFRQFGASRLQLPLDDRAWPHLRLTLDNSRSPAIPITGARVHPAPPVRVPDRPIAAEIVDREETGRQTRLTLRLSVASATLGWLKLQTPEPLFARTVSVVHRRVNESDVTETVLARDTIFRLAANGAAAEDVTVEVKAIIPTREVILVIDNGDSPPLPVTGVTGGGHPAVLTFHTGERRVFHVLGGNPRATAPRYDVSLLVGQLTPTHATPETIGGLAVNPAWRAPEALSGLDLRGTPIDLGKWKLRKPLTLAAPGVQRLELDLEVLAHAAPYFADLRVVRDGRQLPYLLDRTPVERQFAPVATRVTDPKRPTVSQWELKLPHQRLPLSRIECATSAALFQRAVTLTEERRDDRGRTQRVRLGGTEWVRTPDKKSARLAVAFLQPPLTDTVRLEVENGDNPALELTDFTCSHPTARVLFQADPGAETFLYFANPAAVAARYDLNLVAHQLISAEKSKATLGPVTALQPMKLGADDAEEGSGAGKWIFWIALGSVVGVLLFVLAKLLPKPAGE